MEFRFRYDTFQVLAAVDEGPFQVVGELDGSIGSFVHEGLEAPDQSIDYIVIGKIDGDTTFSHQADIIRSFRHQ